MHRVHFKLIHCVCIRLTIKSIFEMHINPRRTISKLYALMRTCQTSCTFPTEFTAIFTVVRANGLRWTTRERKKTIKMKINLIERKHWILNMWFSASRAPTIALHVIPHFNSPIYIDLLSHLSRFTTVFCRIRHELECIWWRLTVFLSHLNCSNLISVPKNQCSNRKSDCQHAVQHAKWNYTSE